MRLWPSTVMEMNCVRRPPTESRGCRYQISISDNRQSGSKALRYFSETQTGKPIEAKRSRCLSRPISARVSLRELSR